MIRELQEDQYTKAWREFDGSPLQSWAWGDVKKGKWGVERIGIFDNEELISIATLFYRQFPYPKITRLLGLKRFVYIPRGIAVMSSSNIQKALSEIGKYLEDKNVSFILIDPELNFFINDWNRTLKDSLEKERWEAVGETFQPNQTNIIMLDKSEEELFASFRPKWRRNIKKAKRQGVVIKEVENLKGVREFYSILRTVSERNKFGIHPQEYFEKIWNEMVKDRLVRIFSAYLKGNVVASYLLLLNEKVAYEVYGGVTKQGRDCEASFLLKWEVIKQMLVSKKIIYDQWGVSPKDATKHPLLGISYFKSGFGGEYKQLLPQYGKVYNQFSFSIYRLFRQLRFI